LYHGPIGLSEGLGYASFFPVKAKTILRLISGFRAALQGAAGQGFRPQGGRPVPPAQTRSPLLLVPGSHRGNRHADVCF